jgi:hypothetical protein
VSTANYLAVMHVCLLPTEILLHIFTIDIPIAKCYNWTPPASCAQLAVLARTCRKFKEPALDILWEHIAGFRPLISCLPEGVINIDRRGNLVSKMPEHDIDYSKLLDRSSKGLS